MSFLNNPFRRLSTQKSIEARIFVEQYFGTRIFGEKNQVGIYSMNDWYRLELALDKLVGNTFIDIGPGNGAFARMIKKLFVNSRVTCFDIKKHSKLNLTDDIELCLQDITQESLVFKETKGDTVVAMEVIEHLDPSLVPTALNNIRSMAKKRVIVTIPYKEPFPLHHQDKPTGHKQSFDDKKILKLFPHAEFFLLPLHNENLFTKYIRPPKCRLMMIVEDVGVLKNNSRVKFSTLR